MGRISNLFIHGNIVRPYFYYGNDQKSGKDENQDVLDFPGKPKVFNEFFYVSLSNDYQPKELDNNICAPLT